ncbi:MAG TPA: LPS export ABC transporter ATP-binding protein [Gemmatimonadaceae bacterium]|nr:LPS export ABC transporter ATP-binding protein [Gemmatimonadaceae bacterium]
MTVPPAAPPPENPTGTPPSGVRALADQLAKGDRSIALALHALISVADATGLANVDAVIRAYREDHLAALRAAGHDAEREAGRLSLDEVRQHLAKSVFPRLAADGVVAPPLGGFERAPEVWFSERAWRDIVVARDALAVTLRQTGEHAGVTDTRVATPVRAAPAVGGSVLEAHGLVKSYRRRRVVNDVALRLQQGEIVGLLGPNGAGKTTTFYMIVGLIEPLAGRIVLDGADITSMPMYKRARQGIGYLSQEPSIFRKLSVEDNILAILETLGLPANERRSRLETLLDELSIKHLRNNKAFSLSGGERRRLEITRALVTQPKFMMLDEPFAGVDPIAVHDIQQIVGNLRHRGIGVLISDHNVEQTLDIVDRAYIMFDGQVKVSGTVRELVFDDTVADIYLGPTLTARLRARFAAANDSAPAA